MNQHARVLLIVAGVLVSLLLPFSMPPAHAAGNKFQTCDLFANMSVGGVPQIAWWRPTTVVPNTCIPTSTPTLMGILSATGLQSESTGGGMAFNSTGCALTGSACLYAVELDGYGTNGAVVAFDNSGRFVGACQVGDELWSIAIDTKSSPNSIYLGASMNQPTQQNQILTFTGLSISLNLPPPFCTGSSSATYNTSGTAYNLIDLIPPDSSDTGLCDMQYTAGSSNVYTFDVCAPGAGEANFNTGSLPFAAFAHRWLTTDSSVLAATTGGMVHIPSTGIPPIVATCDAGNGALYAMNTLPLSNAFVDSNTNGQVDYSAVANCDSHNHPDFSFNAANPTGCTVLSGSCAFIAGLVVFPGTSVFPGTPTITTVVSPPWSLTRTYPIDVSGQSCVVNSGFVYCIGGSFGYNATNSVYIASLSSTGVGAWSSTTPYPTIIYAPSCVVNSGFVYCIGGDVHAGGTYLTSAVYFASLSSNGVGAWSSTTAYPTNVIFQSCVVNSGFVYCIGGESPDVTSSVYFASLSSTGVGAWSSTTPYPTTIAGQSCVVSSELVYCIGGADIITGPTTSLTSSVYFASLSSSGVGAWSPTTPYPTDIGGQSCLVSFGSVYCIGGIPDTGYTSSVYFASLSSSGVGAWSPTTPYPTDIGSQSCLVSFGSAYCIGGYNNSGNVVSAYFDQFALTVGGTTADQAFLSGGYPLTGVTGNVSYTLHSNGNCAGMSTSEGTVPVGPDNSVGPSNSVTFSAPGTYSFNSTYNGDSDNTAATSACESFTVYGLTGTTTALFTSTGVSLPIGSSVASGTSVYDTANITGVVSGFAPSGNMTYVFYTNGACSGSGTNQTIILSGGTIPRSASQGPLTAGSYSFQASYGGDGNYPPSTSSCEYFTVMNGFQFSLSNSGGIVVSPGSSGSNTITVTLVSGSAQSVTLSVSGLPSGASPGFSGGVGCGGAPTCTVTPNPSISPTLTIVTMSSTPLGQYNIVVTGTSTGSTKVTTQFILTVVNWGLTSPSPSSLTVLQGSTSAPSSLNAFRTSGPAPTLTFSISTLPTGVTANFPTTCTPSCTFTITFSATPTASLGTVTVTISASDGQVIQTQTLSLTINSGSSVGGTLVPIDKLGLIAPYIGLISVIIIATLGTVYLKRVRSKRHRE
jgi:hypothetical protein